MSAIILIVLIVLLVYGGDRLGMLGKGLGEGVKAFRRTIRQTETKAPATTQIILVEQAPPKLLPAKGESSPESPGSDHERH